MVNGAAGLRGGGDRKLKSEVFIKKSGVVCWSGRRQKDVSIVEKMQKCAFGGSRPPYWSSLTASALGFTGDVAVNQPTAAAAAAAFSARAGDHHSRIFVGRLQEWQTNFQVVSAAPPLHFRVYYVYLDLGLGSDPPPKKFGFLKNCQPPHKMSDGSGNVLDMEDFRFDLANSCVTSTFKAHTTDMLEEGELLTTEVVVILTQDDDGNFVSLFGVRSARAFPYHNNISMCLIDLQFFIWETAALVPI